MSSFNFKDDLTIDNNRYLKWLDNTGARKSIIGLNSSGNLNINSNNIGDIYVNSNNTGSNTFININNNNPVYIASKINIGLSSGNYNSNITLPQNSWIGLNNNSGYLALSPSSSLDNSSGSRIILNGNTTLNCSGSISVYTGNNTTANVSFFVGKDSLSLQLLNSGSVNFTPDGITTRLSVSDINTSITNPLIISSTVQSYGPTTGAVQVAGGIGIKGNTYIDGTLSINSVSGNINFNNSAVSTSYSTGTIFISGGFGIECSTPASSPTAGGGLSVAGGLALGQNAMIAGDVTVFSTTLSISSQTGSIIGYGGLGINGQINLRSDTVSQIRLVPVTNNNETSLLFCAQNDYTTTGSWAIGQNMNSIGSNIFTINNNNSSFISLNGNTNIITLNKDTILNNTAKFTSSSSTTTNLITFASPTLLWAVGRNTSDFFVSRNDTSGNLLNYGFTLNKDTGNVTIYSTENTSSITGGSLSALGGVSIQKNLNVGGGININGILNSGTNIFNTIVLNSTDVTNNITGGALLMYGGINMRATTDSVNTSTGSLTLAGGMSVQKSLYATNIISSSINTTIISSGNGLITNISSSNLYSTNLTTNNIYSTNSSFVNLLNTNSTITNSTIINSTMTNLILTNASITSLIATSSLLTNVTTVNAISTNLTTTNLYNTNNTTVNANITNNTVINLISTNSTVSSLVITNKFSSINSNTIGSIFTTGGNTGINTVSPTNILSVFGNTDITNNTNGTTFLNLVNLNTSGNNSNTSLLLGSGTSTGNLIVKLNGPFNTTETGVNNAVIRNNNGCISLQSMSTSTSLFLNTNGNVGINTTTPSLYNLDIKGSIRTNISNNVLNTENNITNSTGNVNFLGDVCLSGTSSNTLIFSNSGVNTPTLTTRSIGTKIVLSPNISSTLLDYSIGVESGFLWQSVPVSSGYKWYIGDPTSVSMLLNSSGNLIINSTGISSNSSTGSFVINGGVSINNTTNSSSYTTGGALTIRGGVAIRKDVFIGGNLLDASLCTVTMGNLLLNSTTDSFGIGSGGGCLTVLGGTSIGKNLYIGNNIGVGISGTSISQSIESSPINYSSNQDGGIRISTKNPISFTDPSYRYIDLRLKSDSSSYFKGSIIGTLSGGTSTEYEYMSFSQDSFTNINSFTKFVNTTASTNSSTGSIIINGGISLNNTVNSSSVTEGGSLTLAGGASIFKDLYVGGQIRSGSANSSFVYLTLSGTAPSINSTTGVLIVNGGIGVTCTVDASSFTNGGCLTIGGGMSVTKSLYVGNTAYIQNTSISNGNTANLTVGNLSISNTSVSSNSTTGAFVVKGGISISNTMNSTSTTYGGSLTIAGGASIFKDLYVGNTITSSSDERLKKDFRPIIDTLSKIDKIRTVRYKNKDELDNNDYIGFIAQDFEENFPELLKRENTDAFYSLDYSRVTVLLLNCIKDLKKEIEILKNKEPPQEIYIDNVTTDKLYVNK